MHYLFLIQINMIGGPWTHAGLFCMQSNRHILYTALQCLKTPLDGRKQPVHLAAAPITKEWERALAGPNLAAGLALLPHIENSHSL